MGPIAEFTVSENGRNGTLRVFPDRIERSSRGTFRKNTGIEITPFSRVSSVQLKRHLRRHEVSIFASGNTITVTVYGNAEDLVRLLNEGMAGRLGVGAPVAVPPSGPAVGWYPDPSGGPFRRWWDGTRWTEHLQPPT